MQEILKGINSKVFLGFCLMLSLFWAWNWVVFQSATVLTIELGSTGITIPCRSVSLGAFSLTSLVIFLAYRKGIKLQGKARWIPRLVLIFALLLVIVSDAADGSLDGESTGYLLSLMGGSAMGVVGALIYASWGKSVAEVGLYHYRAMVLACVISCFLASFMSWGAVYLSMETRQVTVLGLAVAFFPAAAWVKINADMGDRASVGHRPAVEESKIPGKFVVTLLALGLSLGLMQGIFSLTNEITILGSLTSVGYALAALFVAFSVFVVDLDFNRLLYQVGFPLMAVGFMVLAGWGNGMVGYLFSITGYRFSEIVVWMLCVFLMSRLKQAQHYLFPLLGCVLGLGQALGLLCYSGYLAAALSQIAIVVAGALFIGALFLVTTKGESQSWGIVTPGILSAGALLDDAVAELSAATLLTAREAEIFALLARGKNRRAISEDLVLSENTVKTHIAKIYRKLGVSSQQELISVVENRAQSIGKKVARDAIG